MPMAAKLPRSLALYRVEELVEFSLEPRDLPRQRRAWLCPQGAGGAVGWLLTVMVTSADRVSTILSSLLWLRAM